MTDEMIEQVARAITEVLRAKGASSRMMENAGKDAARAAIAAMREPTLEMRHAGRRVKSSWLVENEEVEIWQNMIDESLK